MEILCYSDFMARIPSTTIEPRYYKREFHCPDLGNGHDELKARKAMKRKMAARRKLEDLGIDTA